MGSLPCWVCPAGFPGVGSLDIRQQAVEGRWEESRVGDSPAATVTLLDPEVPLHTSLRTPLLHACGF